MIRLKVFISSVQKELRSERIAIGGFLSTDDFLSRCTAPRIFEDYPQPLRPNPKAYLDLLRQCQICLLIVGREYGDDAGDGLSATHQEYRLAQELKMPTLVCVMGPRSKQRDEKTRAFLNEIEGDHHIYSRFHDEDSLLKVVADRLREHIETTYATVPRKEQIEQGTLTRQSASNYEREAIAELSYEDMNVDLSTEMIAAAEDLDKARVSPLELPRLLLSRGYLWKDSANNVLRPTIAGTLLLANRPGIVLPQARVQLDVYAGSVRSADPIDAVFIDAALPSAIEQAVAFIRRNTSRPLIVEGLKRKSVEAYPPEALREVIVNAVAHRDYSDPGAKVCVEVFADRLRVTSPGLPPGGQSIERLARGEAPSRARNPLVVQGLFWLEFMDERGSGIRRMTKVLEQAGHARPVFRAEHDSLVVEFLSAQVDEGGAFETLKQLTDNESDSREKILKEIERSGTIRTKICVQRLGIPRATAQRILAQLVEEGIIESIGAGPKTSYRLIKEAK